MYLLGLALLVATVACIAACPQAAFADTSSTSSSINKGGGTTPKNVTIKVLYKSTTGESLGSSGGSGQTGATYASTGLASIVDARIATLKADKYAVTNYGGWSSTGKFPAKDTTYTITFQKRTPIINNPTVTVTVKLTNKYDGSTGSASGSAQAGTKLSAKGSNGKSLVDQVNDLIAWQKKQGFVLAKQGTTWPGNNGVYPSKNTTYTLNFEPTDKPVYWLVNKKTGENLYTAEVAEKNALSKKSQWSVKGIVWYAPIAGEAVYRLVNKVTNDHHWTKSKKEADTLVKRGKWRYDFNGKPAFYSGGAKDVWRLRHDKRIAANKAGTHRFATSSSQVGSLEKSGWASEGKLIKATRYK